MKDEIDIEELKKDLDKVMDRADSILDALEKRKIGFFK